MHAWHSRGCHRCCTTMACFRSQGSLRARRVPEDCTYEEKQLVKDCLQNEPDERPSAKDIVNRLAGSQAIRRTLSNRSSSLSGAGSFSGQTLADRCAALWNQETTGPRLSTSLVLSSKTACTSAMLTILTDARPTWNTLEEGAHTWVY